MPRRFRHRFLLGLLLIATFQCRSVTADEPAAWVDLLEWSEGFDWTPRGYNWNEGCEQPPTKQRITLVSKPYNRVPLPAILDGDYDLEVEFVRHTGRESVNLIFPVGVHNMHLEFGAQAGAIGGVHWIDGKSAFQENPTVRRPLAISNNQTHRIAIRVRHTGETASFEIDWDGKPNFITWSGHRSRLKNLETGSWKLSMIRRIWLGSFENRVTFQKVRVRMVSGEVRKDAFTPEDRQRDLADGFLKLVGEPVIAPTVASLRMTVNQIPLDSSRRAEEAWPILRREFNPCRDFYGAHAPSRLKCPIPKGAESFSVFGYNDGSRTTKFLVYVDGVLLHETAETGMAPIKIDLPPKSTLLELLVEQGADGLFDHSYWCYPKFHSVAADKITDEMLDANSRRLKFVVASQTVGHGTITYNAPIRNCKSIPIHFRDAIPCDEFVLAVANSSLTYSVPEGMTRFTAIGYNVISHHVKYEVWADARKIYESPQVGIVPIDVKLPTGTVTVELKINSLGRGDWDLSMWCYPRLHRE